MKNNFGYSWRAYLIYIFLAISLFILVFRIVSLKYIEGDFLTSKGKSMLKTSRIIPAIRGSILDKNNFPLAVSINQYDLYALRELSNPETYKGHIILGDLEGYIHAIDPLTGITVARKKISRNKITTLISRSDSFYAIDEKMRLFSLTF